MIVELGCGKNKRFSNSIGVDINPESGADIIHDINEGLPFIDECVDIITSSHFMEHVKDFGFVMRECHRVLKKGGILEFTVPYHSNHRSYFPHHVHPGFSWISMVDYFNLCEQYDGIKFRLMVNRIVTSKGLLGNIIDMLVNYKPYLYDRFLSFVFPSSELYIAAIKSNFPGVRIKIRKKSVLY